MWPGERAAVAPVPVRQPFAFTGAAPDEADASESRWPALLEMPREELVPARLIQSWERQQRLDREQRGD